MVYNGKTNHQSLWGLLWGYVIIQGRQQNTNLVNLRSSTLQSNISLIISKFLFSKSSTLSERSAWPSRWIATWNKNKHFQSSSYCRPSLLHLQCYMVSRGHQRTHTLDEKSRAFSSRCCGVALSHRLVLYIGLSLLHLSPLDRIVQEKLLWIWLPKSDFLLTL